MSDMDSGTPSESYDASESIDDETIENELEGEIELTDDEPELTDDDEETLEDEGKGKQNERPKKDEAQPKKKTETKAKPAQEKGAQKKAPREIGEDGLDDIVTVKVNGETKKMTVRELTRLQSLEQASHRKMQEAAEERRKAAALADLARTNPAKFFELAGVDQELVDKLAEERLATKYTRASMTDEERELHDFRAEKQKREEAETQSKQSMIDEIEAEAGSKAPDEIRNLPPERLQIVLAKLKEQNQKSQNDLDEQIGGAWKESGLPKHPRFVQLIAQVMRNHLHRTKEPLQAKEAAAIVKRDFATHVREITTQMDATAIREMLGDDVLKKLRDSDIERVTGRKPISHDPTRRPATAASTQRPQKQKEMSPYEYRAYMAELKKGLRD